MEMPLMNVHDNKININNVSITNRFVQWLLLLMGIFVTMPIIVIKVGGFEQSVFQILFIFSIFVLFFTCIKKHKIIIRVGEKMLLLWLFVALFSSFVGWIYFGMIREEFANNTITFIPKIIMFIVFLILLSHHNQITWNEALLKGIVVGCIINLVWTVIDAGGYYIIGKSINNIVFSGYALRHNIHYNSISIIKNGMIRASGFNYDPAQIGFISPFILSYGIKKKSAILSVLSFLGVISSASTTALVCSLVIVLLSFDKKKALINIRNFKMSVKRIIIIISGLIIVFVLTKIYRDRLSVFLNATTSNFFGRVRDVYVSNQGEGVRWQYIKCFPKAFLNIGVFMLFGTGLGTASYGYIIDSNILSVIGYTNNFAYDMENTYLSYLLDTGIVGFALFYFYLFKGVGKFKVKSGSNDSYAILYALFMATLLSMIFYHYILFSVQMLGLIVGTMYLDAE